MRRLHVVAAVVVVSAMFGLCVSSAQAQDRPAAAPVAQPAKAAPDFTLMDQKGASVALSSCKGKVVVLEWINPECPFVQRHYKAGTMVGLANRYAPKGVIWLAINTTHTMTRESNAQWAAMHQVPYPILDDHAGVVGKLYSAKTTPHMFVIDASGKIVYQGAIDNDPRGGMKEGAINYVAQALDEVLAGKPVSTAETKPYGCSVKYAK